jgi:hypothetical protein
MSVVEYEIISNNHDEKGKAELTLSSRSSGGSGKTVALTGNKGGIDIAVAVVEPKCLHTVAQVIIALQRTYYFFLAFFLEMDWSTAKIPASLVLKNGKKKTSIKPMHYNY